MSEQQIRQNWRVLQASGCEVKLLYRARALNGQDATGAKARLMHVVVKYSPLPSSVSSSAEAGSDNVWDNVAALAELQLRDSHRNFCEACSRYPLEIPTLRESHLQLFANFVSWIEPYLVELSLSTPC